MASLDPKDPLILEKIAALIKAGADAEDFQDILDLVLGTAIPEVDDELEDSYQAEIRDGN